MRTDFEALAKRVAEKRRVFYADNGQLDNYSEPCEREDVDELKYANLVSSISIEEEDFGDSDGEEEKWNDIEHYPVLDLDFPCTLVPSTTPEHYHLYLDKPLKWHEYKQLLIIMQKVGLLQEGFVRNSIARGATFVRKPGVRKEK